MRDQPLAAQLLNWYDRHGRSLPWRVSPQARAEGQRPDPYRVWMSEIMLQQTTVAAVKSYFETFASRWPTVEALAAEEDAAVMAAWAGLGYYARARNLLKCARVVTQEQQGRFPQDRAALQALPGIGPYTSAAIAAIAFDLPETVVDGNVERVMARLHDCHSPLPAAKPELTGLAEQVTPTARPGDYAQAVMDLGATICTPRNPVCGLCPWREPCKARQAGTATELPKKSPKKPKPTRYGTVFLARRSDGAWLLEDRPASGLLGGMLGWPGSDWTETAPGETEPPVKASWQTLNGEVRHTFTHFHLRLSVQVATTDLGQDPTRGSYRSDATFRADDLPTVMRKAFTLSQDWFAAQAPFTD